MGNRWFDRVNREPARLNRLWSGSISSKTYHFEAKNYTVLTHLSLVQETSCYVSSQISY
jgi:hypothetical protein